MKQYSRRLGMGFLLGLVRECSLCTKDFVDESWLYLADLTFFLFGKLLEKNGSERSLVLDHQE